MNKLSILVFLLSWQLLATGAEAYKYKRQLEGVEDDWHKTILPSSLVSKLNEDMSDIRVYGILEDGDTVEAPYIFQEKSSKLTRVKKRTFLMNQSFDEEAYYYTLQLEPVDVINSLSLNFRNKNFDWKVRLEGSHNQKQWHTFLTEGRVLSLVEDGVHLEHTQLRFGAVNYPFVRLSIFTDQDPELVEANVFENRFVEGETQEEEIRLYSKNIEKKGTQIIAFDLVQPAPISYLTIDLANTHDFYRPVSVWYCNDSSLIEEKWIRHFQLAHRGTINSFIPAKLNFQSATAQKWKLIFHDGDNEPLNVKGLKAYSSVYELTIRFDYKASYFLVYGNAKARKAEYDLMHYLDKIPNQVSRIELGEEEALFLEEEQNGITPLFENKSWIWLLIAALVGLLAIYSIRMLRD